MCVYCIKYTHTVYLENIYMSIYIHIIYIIYKYI